MIFQAYLGMHEPKRSPLRICWLPFTPLSPPSRRRSGLAFGPRDFGRRLRPWPVTAGSHWAAPLCSFLLLSLYIVNVFLARLRFNDKTSSMTTHIMLMCLASSASLLLSIHMHPLPLILGFHDTVYRGCTHSSRQNLRLQLLPCGLTRCGISMRNTLLATKYACQRSILA